MESLINGSDSDGTFKNLKGYLKNPYYFVSSIFVAVILLIVTVYLVNLSNFEGNKENPPSGKIYLTLIPNDFSSPQGMYSFNVSSGELEPFFIDFETPAYNFNGSFSLDGERIAYMAEGSEGEYAQLYVMDKDKRNKTQITQGPYHKKDPRWSPNGKYITFVVNQNISGMEDDVVADNWEVYITDLAGNERFISKGVNPTFSPDGSKVLIMRDNGLNLVDIFTKENALVWNMVEGSTYTGMKFSLSDDKSLLAWSIPTDGEILIIRITSWEPFRAFIIERFQSSAFWPTFSPDNRYIAAQEVDWGPNDNQRLIIYDRIKKTKETILDLTDYYQEAMFINDWQ